MLYRPFCKHSLGLGTIHRRSHPTQVGCLDYFHVHDLICIYRSVTAEGTFVSESCVELRSVDFNVPARVGVNLSNLLSRYSIVLILFGLISVSVDSVDKSSLSPGFQISLDYLRSESGTNYHPIALRINWRTVLHSYTLKMPEQGELALRLAINKLNSGKSKLRTVRPWLGVVTLMDDQGHAGTVQPISGSTAADRSTVVNKKSISFNHGHHWPNLEGSKWRVGTPVLCWSRAGECHIAVMMEQPSAISKRKKWTWPALSVA